MNKDKRIGRKLLCLVVSLVMVCTLIPHVPGGFAYAEDLPEEVLDQAAEPATEQEVVSEEETAPAEEETLEEEVPVEEETPVEEEVPAEEEVSEDEAPEVAEAAEEQPLPLEAESEHFKATVTYGSEAGIPEGAYLVLTEFAEGSTEYEETKAALVADEEGNSVYSQTSEEEQENLGMAAFDLTIYDAEGNVVEPVEEVAVNIEVLALPEGAEADALAESMEIQHLNESTGDVVVEKVATVDSEEAAEAESVGEIAVDTEQETAVAETVVDGFSTFTITWRNGGRTVTVHYVDQNGNELTISNPNNTHPDMTASSSSPAFLIYDVDGYEYDHTYRNTDTNANRIAPLLAKNDNNRWMYNVTRNVDWYGTVSYSGTEMTDGDDIYVVYKKKPDTTTGGTPEFDEDEEWPEGDNAPQFTKSSKNNGDGTNLIKLSIVGGEKPVEKSTPADVIVVFDVSGSMKNNLAGTGWQGNDGNYYTGSQYNPQLITNTRLSNAKTAVDKMADTLLANDGVRMALISFSTDAQVVQGFTDNGTTYKGKVDALTADGGTNWEKALELADTMDVREDAATYVIFVTDGDPTFRASRGDVTNSNLDMYSSNTYEGYRNNGVFGEGNNDSEGRNFDFAVDQVESIDGNNKNFYAIGISNSVTKVRNLTTEGGVDESHAFLASDEQAMADAFEEITEAIKSSLGFGDVQITDGITELTNAEMKVMETVDPDSFKYYKTTSSGTNEWTTREADGCNPATYNEADGAVHWDMGEGFQLESGVTYTVTFRVWPSQDSYDLIAELNNGTKVYAAGQSNSITDAERAQVVEIKAPTETTPGEYALKTNTDKVNATYSQTSKTGETVTVSGEQDIEATYLDGGIENMDLESMKLTIKKVFEDDLTGGEDRETEVTLVLQRRNAHQDPEEEFAPYPVPQAGGTTSENIVLNDDNNWTYSLYVAPGVEVDGEVLEHGYDFTITEPGIDYHYGLIEEIINPMVVDGEDKYYGDGYLIDDEETISQYTDKSLTAVDRVKSGIDIKKVFLDEDGNEIFPETEFTIKGKLLGPDGQPYTWQDGDDVNASGAYHKYDKDGNRIIYKGHFADSSNIEFTLKPGEYVRFINVPDGCTFEFDEDQTSLEGVEWMSTVAKTQHRTEAGGDFTTEGDVQPTVDGSKASLTTGVVGNKQYSITFTNHVSEPTTATVVKTFEGITEEDLTDEFIEGYKVNANYNNVDHELTIDKDELDGLTYTWTIEDLVPGDTLTVTESGYEDITGYEFVEDDSTVSGMVESLAPADEADSNKVELTNKYDRDTGSLKITKVLENDEDNEVDVTTAQIAGATFEITGPSDYGTNGKKTVKYGTNFTNGVYTEANVPTGTYTVTESGAAVTGYDLVTVVEPANGATLAKNGEATITVTNTYTQKFNEDEDEVNKPSFEIQKNDQDGSGMDGVTFTLKSGDTTVWTGVTANGGKASVNFNNFDFGADSKGAADSEYTFTLTETAPEGYTGAGPWTIKVGEDGDVIDVVLDEETGFWHHIWDWVIETFTGPADVENYEWDGENLKLTVTNQINAYDLVVTKTFSGNDGNLPEGYKVTVSYKDVKNAAKTAELTLTDEAKQEDGSYSWTVEGVRFATEATATETNTTIPGYTLSDNSVTTGKVESIATEGNQIDLNNIYEHTEYTATKVWDDNSDQDGLRPATIQLQLKQNGKNYGDPVTVGPDEEGTTVSEDGNSWTYTWTPLETKVGTKEAVYTADEVAVPDEYEKTVEGDTITNTHEVYKTSVVVSKVWDDADDKDGVRPDSVTIRLLADGEEFKTAELNEANKWAYAWVNLDVNKAGKAITYTVEEVEVEDYEATVGKLTGNADDGYKVKITNYHKAKPDAVMIDPPVQKVVKGNPSKDETFTFQMKAITEGAPMPEGAKDGVMTMNITGSGEKEFGEAWIKEAGTYVYEITEVDTKAANYKYDSTVYTLTVEVEEVADGTQYKLVKTETVKGGDGKIVFTNTYEEPPVKTGDTTVVVPYIVIGISALILLLMLLFRTRKNRA